MKMQEILKSTGLVSIVHTDSNGIILDNFTVPNLVTTVGKGHIAAKIVAITNSPLSMTHMAIGTNITAAAVENIALGVEAGRVALSTSIVSTNTVTYTATFPPGTGTGAITEAGIFNDGTTGTMLCRTTFPIVTKSSGDTVAFTWVITVS